MNSVAIIMKLVMRVTHTHSGGEKLKTRVGVAMYFTIMVSCVKHV